MAFAFVQTKQNTVTATSLVLTLDAATIQNNLVVVNLKFSGSAPASVTVTDSAGNTYALAYGPYSASGAFIYQFYGVQVAGGATTVTISYPTSLFLRGTADEFSGGALTNATVFDTTSRNFGTGTTGNVSTPAFTPAIAGELIVAGVHMSTGGTFAAGSNYVTATANSNGSTMYRLSGTTSETAPCSWTSSVAWSEIASAFKPLGSGGNSGFLAFM